MEDQKSDKKEQLASLNAGDCYADSDIYLALKKIRSMNCKFTLGDIYPPEAIINFPDDK